MEKSEYLGHPSKYALTENALPETLSRVSVSVEVFQGFPAIGRLLELHANFGRTQTVSPPSSSTFLNASAM
jgi:hypothetical protein